MDCCSRINHGFHVARHVVRTTVDVQRECGDPLVISRNALNMTVHMTRTVFRFCNHTHGCQHWSCSFDHFTVRTPCLQSLAKCPPSATNKTLSILLVVVFPLIFTVFVWALGPLPFTFPLGCPLPLSHLPCPLPLPLPLGWPLPSFTSPISISNVPPDSHDFLDRT